MNNLEKEMVDLLIDLKENYNSIGVKAEFEAEGTRFDEALRLKDIVSEAGLNLTIKIGGCEAITDMYEAKRIGVNSIVAPMIESAYAMKKFVNATKYVFNDEERDDIEFHINIETVTGFQNLDKMVVLNEFNNLSGVVLGRDDMTGSMGLTREFVDDDEILDIAQKISDVAAFNNKKFTVGGGLTLKSIPFFKKINYLTGYETRKVIFDADKALKSAYSSDGLLRAIKFEYLWLKNKRDFYGMIYREDELRMQMLDSKYKNISKEINGTIR